MTQEPSGAPLTKGLSERACRFVAGVDTGFVGAIVVLGWLMFHSWLSGEFWWAKLNVAGALFYGSPVYTMGLGRASFAGAALLLVLYALLGGLFGLIARQSGFTRNLLLGMLLAMTWHLFAQRFFWRRLDSFGPAYFPVLSTLPAHLIFGLSLSRYASRFQRLAGSFGDSSWVVPLMESLHPPVEETIEGEEAPAEPVESPIAAVVVDPPSASPAEAASVLASSAAIPSGTSSDAPATAQDAAEVAGPEPPLAPLPENPAIDNAAAGLPPATGSSAASGTPAPEESSPSVKSDC
ncbi:MAG: hypothetical protein QM757_12795 [Paludibaculum sp.]